MRKTISFTDSYKNEYKHLLKQENPSDYVRKLIRQDILNSNNNTEQKILNLLEKIVNGDIKLNTNNSNNIKSDFKKNALKGLINM